MLLFLISKGIYIPSDLFVSKLFLVHLCLSFCQCLLSSKSLTKTLKAFLGLSRLWHQTHKNINLKALESECFSFWSFHLYLYQNPFLFEYDKFLLIKFFKLKKQIYLFIYYQMTYI